MKAVIIPDASREGMARERQKGSSYKGGSIMSSVSRRGFVAGSAVAAGLAGLAACSSDADTSSDASTPSGANYTSETTEDGYVLVTQDGGSTLSYSPDSGLALIEEDGFAFKDFEGTGELVPYEDWRLSADERAEDLASRISIEQIAGLMCFSNHQSSIEDDASVTDDQKTFIESGVRCVLNAASSYPAFQQATWANNMQAYIEASDNKIPANFSSDPRQGNNCNDWPGNLALAATFDPEVAKEAGAGQAADLRLMGITNFLAPQTDIASEPRWPRFSGTFGEDPALSRDTVRAFIDGVQSTVVDGEDQGWGDKSVVAMVKHWPAEGPGEGGREGHSAGGKYAVYPGDNFEALMIPFVDGAFKLDGKTECAGNIMTSYTIAYDEDEKYGELVGSGFSEYKVKELLRDKYGFQGAACTDWAVLNNPSEGLSTAWGVEDESEWSPAKRASLAVSVGVDQMGGWDDSAELVSAYNDMVEELGEEQAEANFRASAKRILLGYFNTGLFENPYVSVATARAELDKGNEETKAAALAAQVKGIVMLKNENGAIAERSADDRMKVYIPMRYSDAATSYNLFMGSWSTSDASCDLPVIQATAEKYFDVVTDTLAEELTGPTSEMTGAATPAREDLTRLTADEIADVDAVVVIAAAPANASGMDGRDQDGNWVPLSLQYQPYTADNEYVRQVSLSGDKLEDGTQENRSYYGNTSQVTNEYQLDQILEAAALAKEAGKPCIVVLDIQKPMCVHEFEDQVDAIVVSMSGSTEAACSIIAGLNEPSGLLPMQMPKDMLDVEAQLEDVPRDMECYTDAAGNTYDFAFGLNWSGVIDDDRVATYKVAPLTTPEA